MMRSLIDEVADSKEEAAVLRYKLDKERIDREAAVEEAKSSFINEQKEYNDVDQIYEKTADPGTGGKHPIVAALPEGCLKDNQLPPSGFALEPKIASEKKEEGIWDPPKPVVTFEEPEKPLNVLEQLHKEAIERAKQNGEISDPKEILHVNQTKLDPSVISPPGSHTFHGQVTREYANISIPSPQRGPEPIKKSPRTPPEPLVVNRSWNPPQQSTTHDYVNLNPSTRRPEIENSVRSAFSYNGNAYNLSRRI